MKILSKILPVVLMLLFVPLSGQSDRKSGKKRWKKPGHAHNPYLEKKKKNKPSSIAARENARDLKKQKRLARREMRRSKKKLGRSNRRKMRG